MLSVPGCLPLSVCVCLCVCHALSAWVFTIDSLCVVCMWCVCMWCVCVCGVFVCGVCVCMCVCVCMWCEHVKSIYQGDDSVWSRRRRGAGARPCARSGGR